MLAAWWLGTETIEPSPADTAVWDRLRAAHDEAGLPLLDVVLLDGHRWRSLAQATA